MAEILDVEGGGLGGDRLPLRALLLLQLALLVDLLGRRLDDGAVFVQLVLQPLDELVLLVELQLQLVDERVPLAQLLDLLLERVLEVAQGPHFRLPGGGGGAEGDSSGKFMERNAGGCLSSLLFQAACKLSPA